MVRKILASLSCLMLAAFSASQAHPRPEGTEITMMAGAFGIPPKEATTLTAQIRRSVFEEFHHQNPDVTVTNSGGLTLTGDASDSAFLMSMAGGTAPDVFYINFRQYYTFLEQGFARPLDDFIAKDPKTMDRVNPTVDKVLRSYDGHIYAVPFFQVAVALYYRKDHFQEAGLDPSHPPTTWDEFYYDCQRLTEVAPGRTGFELSTPPGYQWQNFLYQAGGEVVQQAEDGRWRSVLASSGGVKAVDFYRKLVNDKWKGADGKPYGPAGGNARDLTDDVRTGKTSMWFGYTNDVVLNQSDLSPSVIGVAALPAGPAGQKNEVNAGMWAISSSVTNPKKLDACWRFIKFFAGDEAARVNTQKCVELGIGNLVNPMWLKKFGYLDLLSQVDPSYVKANQELFKTGHPEPYGKNCQQVYTLMDGALDEARLNPSTPTMEILVRAQRDMDQKLLGYTPPEKLATQRAWALGIFGVLIAFVVPIGWVGLRRQMLAARETPERLPAGISRTKMYRFLAVCLLPAGLSILVWSYYPLGRGLVIAFQDYKLLGGSRWVGMDNFIGVFTQPVFYRAIFNSFLYVGLSLLIGFFSPILLALALNEIPRFGTFFRTVFYLPAMTSSIVVSLVFRQLYDKQPTGLLNALVAPVLDHLVNPIWTLVGQYPIPLTHDWLGDPGLAMFAVVLPGIWAGAGPGSILYLAALKNISAERYEAADIDGANWRQKIAYITLPGLKPLILINLLGVFIAGFKAMENVFVLTQGGPLNSTRTIGLEVWQNAFMYLRFGYATAAAWVMGSILVGFTLIQIRTLLKMRFSAASV